jgi:putative oxidoreductase
MTSQSMTFQAESTRPAWRRALSLSLATSPTFGPVFLRLALAIVMFPHGAQHLLGWFGGYGFSGTMEFFGSMGMPSPISALVILLEFFGPIFLVLGLATRWVALGLSAIMLGAIVTVHGQYGFFMNWFGAQKGEGFEYHLLVIGIGLALLAAGSGRFGLDARLVAGGTDKR